ncbi:MAG: 2-oxoacid:acceptor oxidoreductase subunit alpha [Thermodesulfovibrionales bacterium]
MDYTIKICGEAGQGIQTIGGTLSKVFSKTGYYVFTHQDYESRIRGGHNFYQIRFSDKVISASREGIDILISLDRAGIGLHEQELNKAGIIVYDSEALRYSPDTKGPNHLDVPFESLALRHGGNKIMSNVVAVGSVLGMLGMDVEILLQIIKDTFKKKGEAVIKANIDSAIAGYDYAVKNCPKCSFAVTALEKPKLLINGVEAIGLGAISSGLKFYTAYPMTPSTGIMNFLSEKSREYGIVVEQAEDEVAAINMALGASFAGVRAMTGTSGGGFALMVEGLSLAGMTETPVVIALGQRPGPATGFPTRTEQADLNFALYTAHGEFPRILFAPGSPEQAIYLTNKAFDLAEKYQVPAIILFDQYLADSEWTYERLDLSGLRFNDYRLRSEKLKDIMEYKRHAFTDTGVTPLAIPGESKHLIVTDSDEHDENGHIVEDAETRVRMVEKRLLRKFPLIQGEIEPPILYGDSNAEIVFIGWGSTYGVIRECVDILSSRFKTAMLHFSEIWPFPQTNKFDYLKILREAKVTVCIEHNATGQFAGLMRRETGFVVSNGINRFDGRPFTVDDLLARIEEVIK